MRLILWKEWRDNRLTLLATGLLILLTLGILGFWDQGTFLREQDAPGAAATVAGWSTWMFLTCSLFGPEWHRKHALWLARTPWGLGRAWASKVIFATVAALGMGLLAWLVTKGVIAALGIPVSQARYELMVQVEAVWVLGLVGTWLIAASCWGLRPGFVLFVAPAAAIGFNAPYLGALLDKHWSFPPPTGWDFARSAAIALIVGYLAFTKFRPQRPVRIVGWTLCLAFVGHAPALWAWGQRYQSGLDLDFATGQYTIEAPLMSPNQKYVYFNSRPKDTPAPLIFWFAVNLEDSSLKELGNGIGFLQPDSLDPVLDVRTFVAPARILTPAAKGFSAGFTSWNADKAIPGAPTQAPLPHFDSERFRANHPSLKEEARLKLISPLGFGYKAWLSGNPWKVNFKHSIYYDAHLARLFVWDRPKDTVCALLESGWVVRSEDHNYYLFNPDTRESSPVQELLISDRWLGATESGGGLIQRVDSLTFWKPGAATVSTVSEVGLASGEWRGCTKPFDRYPFDATPGANLHRYSVDGSAQVLGRYDERSRQVNWGKPLAAQFYPKWCLDERFVLGLGGPDFQTIQKLDWKTGELKTLFPKPAQ